MATDYIESDGVKDVIGVKLIGADSQIVDSATLAEQQAQTALLDDIKTNTTGLVKNDKEIPFVWFLVKQAFTDVTTDDIVVSYVILNTETGIGTTYTKRWRGFIDVVVPSPLTNYLVPTGGMPLTLAQFQSVFGNTSDSGATSDAGTFSFIALFKRALEKLTTLNNKDFSTSAKQDTLNAYFSAPSFSVSTTFESNRVAKTTGGTLLSVTGYNSKTVEQFIQIHNTASLPADGAVPKEIFKVYPESNFSFDAGLNGDNYSTGIVVCNSSTATTKTIGSADCWFHIRYRN